MPIYDFKCRDCGKMFELLVRDAGKTVTCPDCSSQRVEKLIAASYMVKAEPRRAGTTCCGRPERCDTPPCSVGDGCRRD